MLLEKCIESFYELSKDTPCNKSYPPEQHKFWIEYMAGGLYNVLIEWAKNGMKQSDEYMAKIASEFVNN